MYPDGAALLAQCGDALRRGGELADGSELVGTARKELVHLAGGIPMASLSIQRVTAALAAAGRGGQSGFIVSFVAVALGVALGAGAGAVAVVIGFVATAAVAIHRQLDRVHQWGGSTTVTQTLVSAKARV